MRASIPVPLLGILATFTSFAQAAPPPPDAFVREIDAGLGEYSKVTAAAKPDGKKVALTGWLAADTVHKIIAKLGPRDVQTFYLQHNRPIAVFHDFFVEANDTRPAREVREKIYFRDGKIVEWITDHEAMGVPHGEDHASMADHLDRMTAAFVEALTAKAASRARKGAKTIEGTFIGIEEGDYAHWNMRTPEGADRSLLILQADPAVQAVLDAPKKFAGRQCRVLYKRGRQAIPEAGGEVEIDQLLSVEWR